MRYFLKASCWWNLRKKLLQFHKVIFFFTYEYYVVPLLILVFDHSVLFCVPVCRYLSHSFMVCPAFPSQLVLPLSFFHTFWVWQMCFFLPILSFSISLFYIIALLTLLSYVNKEKRFKKKKNNNTSCYFKCSVGPLWKLTEMLLVLSQGGSRCMCSTQRLRHLKMLFSVHVNGTYFSIHASYCWFSILWISGLLHLYLKTNSNQTLWNDLHKNFFSEVGFNLCVISITSVSRNV